MQKILLPISLIALTAVVLGCADEFKNSKDSVVSEKKVQAFDRSSFKYDVQPTKEPNRYKVSFNWGEARDRVEISLDGQKRADLGLNDTTYSEVVEGGKTYQYSISTPKTEKDSKKEVEVTIEVPRDQVLAGKVDFNGETAIRVNRLFIRSDAVVTSYRNNLVIEVNEIIGEGGTLQNYPVGYFDCDDRYNGNAGGDILIFAEKASGNLTISMTGSRGCLVRGAGGAGGNLNVSIENGSALILKTELKAALGMDHIPNFGPGPIGTQPTACISLSKEDKNVCR